MYPQEGYCSSNQSTPALIQSRMGNHPSTTWQKQMKEVTEAQG
ncbi:hypothetical protein BRADI_2g01535v3 [Brachypodium distachyon]|uniref:Uncharacterized protein n=1 Tax=Brachypodium distachyon TaxID=15368 RepID=A0A0Q3FW82_BRADI|nr:hypothetical protein BRADI_2g01535v3 [Brachypodium distachyon]